MNPQFSIIVPAYNAADTIVACLESVRVQQGSWECVVVDDGSTDDTASRVRDTIAGDDRFRLIQRENGGTGAALNTGIAASAAPWLASLGADDVYLPEFLTVITRLMDEAPGYSMYTSNGWQVYPDGRRQLYNADPRFRRRTTITLLDQIAAPSVFGCVVYARDLYTAIGGYRPQYYAEDYDLWLRMLAAGGDCIATPEPLAAAPISATQKSADHIKSRQSDLASIADLIATTKLTPEQLDAAIARHDALQRNIRTRQRLYRMLGRNATEHLLALRRRIRAPR
ncbi:MAG: glycosyltransferase [Actinomycetes bacterium]|nr:glycosyltransferase [Actinomycetes bacterium]